ncbi:FYVE zinc finger-domain-containing protein [Mycena pura]|uniref:FYVE zinc finger-domain-containing protein n=1 Tax=Mycena pura TaxID=153505 RepID=A0AAD6Y549_9AGAR|nr:FYVE zinc finger-domain-containing protein [Mycena pura]
MSDTVPIIPYQAYRGHAPSPARSTPNDVSPLPISRPSSVIVPTTPPPRTTQNGSVSWGKEPDTTGFSQSLPVIDSSPPVSNGSPNPPVSPGPSSPSGPSMATETPPEPASVNGVHAAAIEITNGSAVSGSELPQSPSQISVEFTSSSSVASSSSIPEDPAVRPRKTSTFRRVPRNSRAPLPSSPLAGGHSRTASSSSMAHSSLRPTSSMSGHPSYIQPRPMSVMVNSREVLSSSPSTGERPPALSSFSKEAEGQHQRHSTPLNADAVAASLASVIPPPRTSSLAPQTTSPSTTSRASSSDPSRQTTPAPVPASVPASPSTQVPPRQVSAPYRPGFQPKGVYRPRTDEFIAHRKAHATSTGYASAERTKLERRLEKLIALHFPEEGKKVTGTGRQPSLTQPEANRRASSFFDLDLKNILSGGGGKEDIRSAEQRITPWQEDSAVVKCPLCSTNFHPLTNRKHHCRLCGQIICALPMKRPHRPQLCSVLFVVDPKTRIIEEVGEGVDYGVRKRRMGSVGGAQELQEPAEEEKFLRGVRICNQCRPVLLRQQYYQQGMQVPTFAKLYEAFITIEKEIEDSLPQFQELFLSLSHDSQPTKEASAVRKRLLEAFTQYDSLAKRIRNLPTTNGRGSSQERVQIAVMTRANLFLQKNMFPLQRASTAASQSVVDRDNEDFLDPSSATALTLQPLLEQEALLETYVEEAKAQRKFEDAKTLRTNLGEIREEIERVLAAEGLKGKRGR